MAATIPPVRRRRPAALTLAGAVVATLAAVAFAAPPPDPDALTDRIWTLRERGDYAAAMAPAEQAAAALADDPAPPPYAVADARRLADTVARIAALPAEARRALAWADSLDTVVYAHRRAGRCEAGLTIAREQLARRRRWLGEDHHEVGDTWFELGRLASAAGDAATAVDAWESAVAIWRAALGPDHPRVGRVLRYLGELHAREGDDRRAVDRFREAAAVEAAVHPPDHPARLRTLSGLGHALLGVGAADSAAAVFAGRLTALGGGSGTDALVVADARLDLARAQHGDGRLEAAEANVTAALQTLAAAAADTGRLAVAGRHLLARLRQDQWDLVAARRIYEDLIGPLDERRLAASPSLDLVLNDYAYLLKWQGEYAAADEIYRRALAARRRRHGADDLAAATIIDNRAGVQRSQGRLARAAELYRQALAIRVAQAGERSLPAALSHYFLGAVALADGDWSSAERRFETCLTLRRALLPPDDPLRAYARVRLAQTRLAAGDPGAAREHVEAALPVLSRRLGDDRPWTSLARHVAADTWLALDRPAVAESLLVVDAAHYASLRDRGGEGWELATAEFRDPHPRLAGLRLARGDHRGAWIAAETAAARTLDEFLGTGAGDAGPSAVVTPAEVRATLPPGTALVGWCDPPDLAFVRRRWAWVMRADTLQWLRCPDVAPGEPAAAADTLRARLTDPGSSPAAVDAAARALWRLRWRPLAPVLTDVDAVIVVPTAELHDIPVGQLVDDDGVALGDRFRLIRTPSATAHVRLARAAADPASRPVLALGDPPFRPEHLAPTAATGASSAPVPAGVLRGALAGDRTALASLPRLARTRDEVLAIARIWPATDVLLGPAATERNLRAMARDGRLAEFGIIHLATHALIDTERYRRSALVLSQLDLPDADPGLGAQGLADDGLVTMAEIGAQWRLTADVVVLSACETARGRRTTHEGNLGLVQALLVAGARAVVVSLWPVDDQATRLFMVRFHENLAGAYAGDRGHGPAARMSGGDALAEARSHLRDHRDHRRRRAFAHPFYWASFVLIGAP